jgi:hypothetical protein
MASLRTRVIVLVAALVAPACGGKVVVDGGGAAQGSSGVGGAGGEGAGGAVPYDAGPDGYYPPPVAAVYANSSDSLYVINPATNAVSSVGAFQGCDAVTDIAVNRTGQIFATSKTALYAVNPTTAQCTHIADGSYPNSLSFVPQGTVDPDQETLVGYSGSSYVRIDQSTGAIAPIGALGNPGLSSSGDIVSLIGGGTYLTVKGDLCNDCLIAVNPTTGAIVKQLGSIGSYGDVWGLAFWGGTVYGFTSAGLMFSLDPATMMTTPIAYKGGAVGFWGAGSSTAAPM